MARFFTVLAALSVAVFAGMQPAWAQTAPRLSVTQLYQSGISPVRVSSAPSGIDGLCVSACTAQFPARSTVTLTVATDGLFVWEGACKGTSGLVCRVVMDGDKTVTVDRRSGAAKLFLSTSTGGIIDADPDPGRKIAGCNNTTCEQVYPKGTKVLLEESPRGPQRERTAFVKWEGACAGQGQVCQLLMDGDKHVGTVWRPREKPSDEAPAGQAFLFIRPANNMSGGPFQLQPTRNIQDGCVHSRCAELHPIGTNVSVTFLNHSNFMFDHWEGCDSVNGLTCNVKLGKTRTVVPFVLYTGR
jgi:hypothetical protein